ncbi:MAG: EAL domain-containing protein [Hyphomicrobiaceae bacterium]|nr:EAL domain-containing protein [Hyphomicrobiaceae bacterium]
MATDNRDAKPTAAKSSRAGDGFIMMAMAVVTLALCLGLVVQVGLSLWLAVTVSAAFYIGLLTLHTLVRRHDQFDELKDEVDSLKKEIARLSQANATSAPGHARVPAPNAQAPNAQPLGAQPPQDAGKRAPAGEAGSRPGGAGFMPRADANLGPAAPARPDAMPPVATSAPQVPQVVRAPNPQDQSAPQSGRPAAGSPGRSSTADTPSFDHSPVAGPPMPQLPKEALAHDAAKEGLAAGPRGQGPSLPGLKSSGTPAQQFDDWSYRPGNMGPGNMGVEAMVSPREADVEMIQGLIRKLADEVNAADADKLAPARKPTAAPIAADESAINQSIGALRQTAQTMKAPASQATAPAKPAAAGGHLGNPPVDQQRNANASAPSRAPQAVQPPQFPPRQQPATGQQATAPAAPAETSTEGGPPADIEFDFEALMRRAEPIATMTSMPPPLPTAPNANAKKPASATGISGALVSQEEALATSGRADVPFDDAHQDDALASASTQTREIAPWPEDEADPATNLAAATETKPQRKKAPDPRFARIAAAIGAGRVDVFLEPILDFEKQQARHYEVSLRLRDVDGAPLDPVEVEDPEAPSGILPLYDNLRLKRTANVARLLDERGKSGAVFSTFSGSSLASDVFTTELTETYKAQQSLAGQLVLTFSQADARRFGKPHWAMLRDMRKLGFAFALRAVTDLDMDFEPLVAAGFKFSKLDAAVFLSGLPAMGAVIPAADLCSHLMDLGLMPIVESIVDEKQRAEIQGYGARFGQGQLFGGPRLMKPAAATGTRSAA